VIKELVLTVLSCAVWGKQLAGHKVLFECDNSSVVTAVNKQYTKEKNSHALTMGSLGFFVVYFDMDDRCKHILTEQQITCPVIIYISFSL